MLCGLILHVIGELQQLVHNILLRTNITGSVLPFNLMEGIGNIKKYGL
jgi:hypothetical protein